MDQKKLISLFLVIGSVVGGYIPALWGANMFSLSSLFLSALGGFLGIYIGYKLGE